MSPILFWLRSTVVSVHHPIGSSSSTIGDEIGTVATANGANNIAKPNKQKIRL